MVKYQTTGIYIAEWSSPVARRAHNPKVMWFKSLLRNQRNPYTKRCVDFFFMGTVFYYVWVMNEWANNLINTERRTAISPHVSGADIVNRNNAPYRTRK